MWNLKQFFWRAMRATLLCSISPPLCGWFPKLVANLPFVCPPRSKATTTEPSTPLFLAPMWLHILFLAPSWLHISYALAFWSCFCFSCSRLCWLGFRRWPCTFSYVATLSNAWSIAWSNSRLHWIYGDLTLLLLHPNRLISFLNHRWLMRIGLNTLLHRISWSLSLCFQSFVQQTVQIGHLPELFLHCNLYLHGLVPSLKRPPARDLISQVEAMASWVSWGNCGFQYSPARHRDPMMRTPWAARNLKQTSKRAHTEK